MAAPYRDPILNKLHAAKCEAHHEVREAMKSRDTEREVRANAANAKADSDLRGHHSGLCLREHQ